MITLTAKITLADGTIYDIDRKNILSIDASLIDRSDISLPSWGLISNGGRFEIADFDGTILPLLKNLKLNSKTKIDIYITDTLSQTTMQVGSFYTSKWNYDSIKLVASSNISDDLTKMQEIAISPLIYDLSKTTDTLTATQIYDYLCNLAIQNGFNMLLSTSEDFDSNTLEHLNRIIISTPFIDATNLWRAFNDFAIAYQLHIYKNRKGVIVCAYIGGD